MNKSRDSHRKVILTGSSLTGSCKVRANRPMMGTFQGYPGLIATPPGRGVCQRGDQVLVSFFHACAGGVRRIDISRYCVSFARLTDHCPAPTSKTVRVGRRMGGHFKFAIGVKVSDGGLLTGVTSSFRGPSQIRALFPRRVPRGV